MHLLLAIGLSADEKYYFISTSDHNTSEQYYFKIDEEKPHPKLIKKREKGVLYSVNSWEGFFYNHTNKDAEDFKIERCKDLVNQNGKFLFLLKKKFLSEV